MRGSAQIATTARVAATRLRLGVRGTVQGVGFRPFVYRRATALGLAGWVENSAAGVAIEAEGPRDDLEALVDAIRNDAPDNSNVLAVDVHEIAVTGESGFAIRASDVAGTHAVPVLPDLATCGDCLRELFDPADRRHRYPFINCTSCGPRYSIVEGIPYDRSRTTMRRFTMCPACHAEYDDPGDRRFHAEPNACPECGPQLALWDATGTELESGDDALRAAAASIRDGGIVAVKGLGGFHLFADARNEQAVRSLRARKRRDEKPFAVMFPGLEAIRAVCRLGAEEEALLTGPAQPIVLLQRTGGPLAPSVAPGGNPRVGALLPYTPLHHLLMGELGFPVIATSGNASDEPIAIDETEALARLSGIADLFLVHDRPITRPVDDSVAHVVRGRTQILRRAKGYAPAPVAAHGLPAGILAFGGHLKTTVALTTPAGLVASQHLGDLETPAARAVHARAIDDIARLHDTPARLAVCDAHPDYATTRAAEMSGLPVVRAQHHVAHIAACMAEHELEPPVLGVSWDGTGYGGDGTVWGGEFIRITRTGWRRVGHLRAFPLPGGASAVREPRRAALGLLYETYGDEAFAMTGLAPVASFSDTERDVLRIMLTRRLNTVITSSAGRLFDAFAALCGLRQRSGYEGQAAAALEWAAEGNDAGDSYDLTPREADDGALVVDWAPALAAALADLRAGAPAGTVSARFHNGLAGVIVAVARHLNEPRVVLTGGCFQNRRLTETVVAALGDAGVVPYWHETIPPNDGGIAVGQAVWAAWHHAREG